MRLAGGTLAIGPYAALNFPWILLDRALAALAYVTHRSHARRDRIELEAARLVEPLQAAGLTVSRWSDEDRREGERIFARWRRRGADAAEGVEQLRSILRPHLDAVAAARLALVEPSQPQDAGARAP